MNTFFKTICILLLSTAAHGQNYFEQFKKYLETGDSTNQLNTLTAWQNASPKDADLYVSYFNYYVSRSRHELLELSQERPDGESLALTAQDDTTKQIAGFLGSVTHFDTNELQKGIDQIEKGINLYPDRLDMRFGKIYIYGQAEYWNEFVTEIIKAIKRSAVNKNRWVWRDNKPQADGKNFFLSSLQDYQAQLYYTENDVLVSKMGEIANVVLEYYPDHVESLSNLAVSCFARKDYDAALKPLLKAEKIAPTDYVIMGNLAHAYREKGDKKNAIAYLEKVVKYSDGEIRTDAQADIEELKKQK